jgi:NAD(P)H-dependent FMN reductase
MSDVLLVCLSQKPAPGQEGKPSATRQLLAVTRMALEDKHVSHDMVDIRESPFPFFDGRQPSDYGAPVTDVVDRIAHCRFLICSVPAYWGGMSGVSKNFFDVLGGAAYDATEEADLLAGKRVGAIIVGGAAGDAAAATTQLNTTVTLLGAAGLGAVVALDDPRSHPDMRDTVQECYQLPFRLVQEAAAS